MRRVVSSCTRGGLRLLTPTDPGLCAQHLVDVFSGRSSLIYCNNGVQGSHSIGFERQVQALSLRCSSIALEG